MASPAPTILIIEGDQATRELYCREISRFYRVLTPADEQDAIALLCSDNIQAIILEPVTFGGRGWHLLASIREILQARGIPLILCSTQDERRRGMALGATVYLVKPVLPSVLLQVLNRIVHGGLQQDSPINGQSGCPAGNSNPVLP
jgi:DNA-binding response OmpR family regulator